ncbi:hypothetical protein [uncultured Fusobacterium sp.]|uniref:hypothetical protein n=1 Tax=uncultured Fusobacterium sp. TaxID=159267 RepID=UPI0025E90B0D|nr:hypothetical protein [uncultured Fusobacterium sp.]
MKKFLLIGILILSSLSLAAQMNIPENVEKNINKSARSFDGSQRVNYINWQKRSYLRMEEIGKESGIPEEEFIRIKDKLHRMYGSNYAKQLQVLSDEINDYKEIVRRVQETTTQGTAVVVDKEVNQKAKEEITKTLNATKIPKEILEIYQSSAEELFPNNYPKQKQYLDICVRDYYKILNIIRK